MASTASPTLFSAPIRFFHVSLRHKALDSNHLTPTRRIAILQAGCLFFFFLILIAGFGAFLAENALHVPPPSRHPLPLVEASSDIVIKAADGAVLHAALFLPVQPHPNYVILLHGVGDTHFGMRRLISMFLRNRYAVLAPDSREHGLSGGPVTTYGIREAPDVHLWADYLVHTEPVRNLYGLGESMGASVLLQSLTVEPRFQAVVAESPFSTFTAIAHDRIFQDLGSDALLIRLLAGPIVSSGLLYARLRYGVDLAAASPLNAVRHSTVPILLIHGLRDDNISPQHSRLLLMANPRHIVPWFVPNAGHTGAFSAGPAVFEERVVSFFQLHQH